MYASVIAFLHGFEQASRVDLLITSFPSELEQACMPTHLFVYIPRDLNWFSIPRNEVGEHVCEHYGVFEWI